METYCSQNIGNCIDCSLVNYGKDCKNNPVSGKIIEGYCQICNRPISFCYHLPNHVASYNAHYNAQQAANPDKINQNELNAFFNN